MATIREGVTKSIAAVVPPLALNTILNTLTEWRDREIGSLDLAATREVLGQVQAGLKLFGGPKGAAISLDAVRIEITGGRVPPPSKEAIQVVSDQDVLYVQRRTRLLTKGFFNATDCVRLATAASELARNIYMYALQGTMTLTLAEESRVVVFTVLAEDKGPGIADLEHVMSGNYVSKTGLGKGLRGTKNLLDGMEVKSAPGVGTTIRGVEESAAPMSLFQVQSGWSARAYEGLTSNGDAAVVAVGPKRSLFAVVDALGHGPDAAKSAQKVRAVLEEDPQRPLAELFSRCDKALVGMRGAVMSAIQVREAEVMFSGVGNVDLIGPANVSRPASVAGILGRGVRAFREYPLKIAKGDRWVLISDGIRARGFGKELEAVRSLPPAAAAKALLERTARPDDDATVLVLDFGGSP